jgi:nitrate/TMAO reductase-like tetraheme cytochrome c subunit
MTRLLALTRHPVALTGIALATTAGVIFLVAVIGVLTGLVDHPYSGLFIFLVVIAGLVVGLIFIPLGMWLESRWERRDPSRRAWPVFDFGQASVRRTALAILALTVANVVILMLAGHGAMQAMESPAFCGQACHTPMQPQFTAWEAGPHAGTACVKCHIGEGAAAFVHAKAAGLRQLAHVFTNSYPRPVPPGAEMAPGAQAETCLGCHRPEHLSADRVRVFPSFGDDEGNSEASTTMRMRVGAIHVHADPSVRIEYIATDAARETIPYVKVTRAGGEVQEFVTADTPAETIRSGQRRVMDCVDCHNTVGHPIAPTPEHAVDRAVAAGQVSRELPHARREGVRLLKASYATPEEASGAIDRELRSFYSSRTGAIDEQALTRTVAALRQLYQRNVFPDMKVSFGSYPNNLGHTTATGCFRCHDGSHTDASGAVIAVDCESCHTEIPAAAPAAAP